MKKIITILMAMSVFAIVSAQEVRKDSAGNFIQVRHDSTTGKTFTDYNGVKHPVYKTKSGKLYFIRTSDKGNKYRSYLKLENE